MSGFPSRFVLFCKANPGLTLGFYLCFFLFYGNHSVLYDQDEAAYFGFSRHFVTSQKWIVPEFPFSEPHRKTPLLFWLGALLFQIFGASEFVFRIPSVISMLGIFYLTFQLGKDLFNKRVGLVACIILSTSLYFPWNGKIALVDSLLVFCQMLGFTSLLKIANQTKNGKYKFLFYLSLLLGVFAKGPPILIFLGGIVFLCLVFSPYRIVFWRLNPFLWGPISMIPVLVWGFWAWQESEGRFVKWYWDWYVLRRTSGSVFGQTGPPGTYLFLFLLGFFPWVFLLRKMVPLGKEKWMEWKSRFKKKEALPVLEALFLFAFVFGWLFYEILPSKLPSYVLSVYPLVAVIFAKALEGSPFPSRIFAFAITIQLALLFVFIPWTNSYRMDSKNMTSEWKDTFKDTKQVYYGEEWGVPSLAVYSHWDWVKIESPMDIEKLPTGSFIVVSPNWAPFLPKQWEALGKQKTLFLYDRNKNLHLQLFQKKD